MCMLGKNFSSLFSIIFLLFFVFLMGACSPKMLPYETQMLNEGHAVIDSFVNTFYKIPTIKKPRVLIASVGDFKGLIKPSHLNDRYVYKIRRVEDLTLEQSQGIQKWYEQYASDKTFTEFYYDLTTYYVLSFYLCQTLKSDNISEDIIEYGSSYDEYTLYFLQSKGFLKRFEDFELLFNVIYRNTKSNISPDQDLDFNADKIEMDFNTLWFIRSKSMRMAIDRIRQKAKPSNQ